MIGSARLGWVGVGFGFGRGYRLAYSHAPTAYARIKGFGRLNSMKGFVGRILGLRSVIP